MQFTTTIKQFKEESEYRNNRQKAFLRMPSQEDVKLADIPEPQIVIPKTSDDWASIFQHQISTFCLQAQFLTSHVYAYLRQNSTATVPQIAPRHSSVPNLALIRVLKQSQALCPNNTRRCTILNIALCQKHYISAL